MLKKLLPYINCFRIKETGFTISKKFKTKTFQYSINLVFHANENIILLLFFRTKRLYPSVLKISCKFRKYLGNIIFLSSFCVEEDLLFNLNFFEKIIVSTSWYESLLLHMNYTFLQNSCFCNNSFLSFFCRNLCFF